MCLLKPLTDYSQFKTQLRQNIRADHSSPQKPPLTTCWCQNSVQYKIIVLGDKSHALILDSDQIRKKRDEILGRQSEIVVKIRPFDPCLQTNRKLHKIQWQGSVMLLLKAYLPLFQMFVLWSTIVLVYNIILCFHFSKNSNIYKWNKIPILSSTPYREKNIPSRPPSLPHLTVSAV